MRGYSSECEVWWADAADDTQDESVQEKYFTALWQSSDDTSPVTVQQTGAESDVFTQDFINLDSPAAASAASAEHF